jgi:preprotein translocase subunit SecY
MTKELARRIAVTIGALLLFRLGTYVPIPSTPPPIRWPSRAA